MCPKDCIRGEEGHYIMLKESIQQEDLTIMNIYAPNVGAAKNIKQLITEVKTYLDNNILKLGDLNTALSTIDRSSKHNISKETRMIHWTRWISQISTELYIQTQLNTHSSQVHMELSPE